MNASTLQNKTDGYQKQLLSLCSLILCATLTRKCLTGLLCTVQDKTCLISAGLEVLQGEPLAERPTGKPAISAV